ncbi:hypothetical protein [Zavarzinia aquatilis]|uniref:Uncharacterized protein n=1 Tax=Zavarzinia aquatilis TaxID=2211142 RepID=A0A317DWZ0_9PROT|nr:hypothetical protein [Zavarzinia aquatilis]PWR19257.1 hypothetical protein DKG74_17405 [Zavarzinia aquatilis]
MLMTLLFFAGFALVAAFVCRALLPAPWSRYVFLALGVPSLGLIVLGLGATVFFYIRCEQGEIARASNDDATVVATLSAVDCGSADDRTFDVTVSLSNATRPLDQTIFRSRGRPAPTAVALTGARSFRVTLEDGSTYDTSLVGEDGTPDKVWSVIGGKVLP